MQVMEDTGKLMLCMILGSSLEVLAYLHWLQDREMEVANLSNIFILVFFRHHNICHNAYIVKIIL